MKNFNLHYMVPEDRYDKFKDFERSRSLENKTSNSRITEHPSVSILKKEKKNMTDTLANRNDNNLYNQMTVYTQQLNRFLRAYKQAMTKSKSEVALGIGSPTSSSSNSTSFKKSSSSPSTFPSTSTPYASTSTNVNPYYTPPRSSTSTSLRVKGTESDSEEEYEFFDSSVDLENIAQSLPSTPVTSKRSLPYTSVTSNPLYPKKIRKTKKRIIPQDFSPPNTRARLLHKEKNKSADRQWVKV